MDVTDPLVCSTEENALLICYFHDPHGAICFQFLKGRLVVPREIENITYVKNSGKTNIACANVKVVKYRLE